MLLNLFELGLEISKVLEAVRLTELLTDPSGLRLTGKSSFWKADQTIFVQPKSQFGRMTGNRTADRAHLELSGL